MIHVICQPVRKVVVMLIMLQIIQGNAWFLFRARRSPPGKPSAPPSAINCEPSVWSAWSECSPFCDNNPTRYRTRTIEENNKCVTKKEVDENACPPRGGCLQFCDNVQKRCSCQSGFITYGTNCVDKNECESNGGQGPCDQKCENSLGSYTCNCNTGYRLEGKHSCTPLDCYTPRFSKCPQEKPSRENEANLALCAKVTSACKNGTKYNSQCSLNCPKNYKLALKNPSKEWSDYSGFEFRTVSSRIICHESSQRVAIWHSKLGQYYCRRNNDPPLSIKLVGTSVKEGLPPGTIVGRLSTNDAQTGQVMVYSIQSEEGDNLFRCNGSVLETSFVLKWSPSHINNYPVRIRAQDNGSPPMWIDRVFNIRVENVNDPPRSIEISRNWVYENATTGTLVGKLSAIDDDESTQRSSRFIWNLLQDNSGKFRIEGNKVLVKNPLSYDKIKLCYIKVSCSDSTSSTEKEIPIYIINLIDPPTLSISGTTIAENSPQGTVIAQIVSKSESNEDLKFMISASNPNATSKFGLSPNTVCKRHENAIKYNISCYVNITVSGQLDYEKTREFTLQVYVRNKASSNFRKWNVSVKNLNEKPDKLEINGMSSIPEDMESGNDICFFIVSDPDNRNEMTQNHSCHLSAEDEEYFYINAAKNSLQIKKNKSLNYEEHQSHTITVTCVDNGVPALNITRQFLFKVTDRDEPIQNLTLSNNKVWENSDIGTQVGVLHAYDPDIHQPQTMKFSLVEPQHSLFALQGMNNKVLVVNGSLNFEKTSDYMLTARVTDTVGRHLQMPFIIKILDVHEAPTDIKLSSQVMKENLPPGSFISNITMIDEDENTLTYCTLLQDDGHKIALAHTTLLAGRQLTDYEQDTSHLIRISLQCCDQFRKCLKKDFNITIQDVNEPPTDITIDNLQVRENEKNITIGNIRILDPDKHSEYSCSLTNSNHTEYLKIVKKTLYLIKELNFEAQQMMMFEITCREKENSSMYFTKQFHLKIVDVNEVPNAGCKEPLFVTYEESFGTVLGSLNVSDPDNTNLKDACKPKQKLKYKIIEHDNLPFTIIDGYLVKTDQVEKNKTYIFEVSVQDDGAIESRKVAEKKTTRFNCTVISRALIGLHITLSSNQISEGSFNASVIGYLGSRENMEYGLMQDKCDKYPFAVEDNLLMLMLPTDTIIRADEKYTVPQYAMAHVNARNKLSGESTEKRFVIFIKKEIPRRLCFSNEPVKLSHLANSKLGPVIIFQDNSTTRACPLERNPKIYFKCNIKPNFNESSRSFTKVDFTNAFYVDDEMYLRANISEKVSNVEKLALDLFCWDPKRLFVFVKGQITIRIAQEGVCENDLQARNESLCENSEQCPEDSLCTKVVNVKQRCVPYDDQLFIIIPAITEGEKLCKFESCLQETLGDKENNCLLTWNEKRRRKRASKNNLYLDTLNITILQNSNKLLLRAALWKLHDNKPLTIVSKQYFPNLQDQNDVIFITSEKECDWLKGHEIKCPISSSSTAGESSRTSLGTSRIRVAVGIGSAILLVVTITITVYCMKKRQQRKDEVKKHSPAAGDFANMAFDDSELKELPPIPKGETRNESIDQKIREKHGKPKYDFKNPVYEDPSQLESIDVIENHIYNETNSQNATYAEPELLLEKSNEIPKGGAVISNPVYAAADIIPIVHPIAENTCTPELKQHHASKDPHYERCPLPDANQINAWKLQNEINKTQQDLNTTNPHYEVLPLPDITEIKLMKSQTAHVKLHEDTKENTSQKAPDYQELSEVKNEKKSKAISRFSKLLSDFIAPKQRDSKLEHRNNSQSDSDRKNSSNSARKSSEISNESMLNPREKAMKANPANKYPFYEELNPVQENNKRLSEQSNKSDAQNGGRNSSHLYHVLEGDNMNNENKNELENENEVGGPRYYVLEKCSSTGKESTQYQSLHRELEQSLPTYESYRLPENSGSDSGK